MPIARHGYVHVAYFWMPDCIKKKAAPASHSLGCIIIWEKSRDMQNASLLVLLYHCHWALNPPQDWPFSTTYSRTHARPV